MIDLPEFKRLVDASPDNITALGGDLRELYDHVGLSATNAWKLMAVLGACLSNRVLLDGGEGS
jgi:hypothetical protein